MTKQTLKSGTSHARNLKTAVASSSQAEEAPGKLSKYMSYKELQGDFNVPRSTIWRWVKDGILPAPIKLGQRTFFDRSKIAEACENSTADWAA